MAFTETETDQLISLLGVEPNIQSQQNFNDRVQALLSYDLAHSTRFEAEIKRLLTEITALAAVDTSVQSLAVYQEYTVQHSQSAALSPSQQSSTKTSRIKVILGYNPGTAPIIRN